MRTTLEEMLDLTASRKGYRDALLAVADSTALCCCCSCCTIKYL
jgi:hypothetical protein